MNIQSIFGLVTIGACVTGASGCSGATFSDGGATSGASDGGAPVGPGASGDGGGASDGGGKPDGGTPVLDGAVSADAGDSRIDPLVVGHAWTYDVTTLGTYPLCPSGSHVGKVVGVGAKDGKTAFEVQSLCANAGSFFYAVDGDVVQWDYQGTWVLSLDAPVQEGHTWTNGVTSYVWHDVGSVTVPAGTFSSCWKAQDTGGPSYTIFCRGVGAIHWFFKDQGGNGYDATMTAKNF